MSLRNRIAGLERDAARVAAGGPRVHAVMARLLSDPAAVELANELARRMDHPNEPAPAWAEPRLCGMSDAELGERLAGRLEGGR